METKKDPKKDLEQTKDIYFLLGLVLSLTVVLVAFEWKKFDKVDTSDYDMLIFDIPEEEIELTRQEEKIEQPPPPQVPEIEIVEDDVEVDDVLDFDDFEDKAITDFEYRRPDVVEEEHVEQEIFIIVENMPEFPGGESALMEYLAKNTAYPPMAKESGIQGTVYVRFVVEPDGSVSNVTIMRGIGGGCDEEALRVVKNMPRWTPGKQRGKPVRVQFNLPIRFVLQG